MKESGRTWSKSYGLVRNPLTANLLPHDHLALLLIPYRRIESHREIVCITYIDISDTKNNVQLFPLIEEGVHLR